MQEFLIEVSEVKCHEVASRVRGADEEFSWVSGGSYKPQRFQENFGILLHAEGYRLQAFSHHLSTPKQFICCLTVVTLFTTYLSCIVLTRGFFSRS